MSFGYTNYRPIISCE